MAKVKITGHASGSGVITVTAPNTSTDRVITLPDSTSTLATTAEAFNPDAAQVFNESGADVDFRVESDTVTHALFVDGATGAVGLGTTAGNYNSTADNLVVYDASNHAGMTIASGAANKVGAIYFADGTSGTAEYEGFIEYNHNTNGIVIGTNHATSMSIDSNGYVTKPKHPNFFAYSNAGNTGYSSGDEFVMNIEATSCPHFSTSTGRFTAPVAGFYHFEMNLYSYTANRWFTIKKNGSDIIINDTRGITSSTTADHMFGTCISMNLAVNDYVSIGARSDNASGNFYGQHTWFSGYLIG